MRVILEFTADEFAEWKESIVAPYEDEEPCEWTDEEILNVIRERVYDDAGDYVCNADIVII